MTTPLVNVPGSALLPARSSNSIQGFAPNKAVTATVVPINTIVTILIASIVVGIFAAIFPARRAAKLDILDAIATH